VRLWGRRSGKVALLKKVPLFDGLSDGQLGRIAGLADEVEAAPGQKLARAGETGRELFIIVEGEAVVRVPRGRTVRLSRGDFFGEISLLDGGPRSATVIAETPMRLLVITRDNFAALLEDVPDLTQTILITLTKRLRQAERALRH
jgi:CRP-like cAMP-binding protein